VFDKISLRVADHLITVSENTKKELMEIFNYKNDSITVIRNGVDIREFSPSNRDDNIKSFFGAEKIVLTVGHLAYRKGIDVLIRAAASILQIFPEVKFVIVGTGEDLAFYRRLSEILGVSRSVCFVGRVSSQFLRKLYATADVFVLPSRYEGQPISILEAMASGCPVVLSRISDIDTYITNYETGLLVPPEDTSALASAIIELLTNENLSKRIRERALTYVRDHFDWSSVADRHIKLYEELIQQENKQKLYSEKD
jgi:glycosyltransferase involved in cell wall biosynthesis